jgi:hypothetical protein
LAALVLLFGLSAGCKRRDGASPESAAPPPDPALGQVLVEDLTPPTDRPARLDTETLSAHLRSRLLATGLFASATAAGGDAGARPSVRARAAIALEAAEVEKKGVARVALRLRLETRPSDAPGAIDENLQAQAEQLYPVTPTAPRRTARGGRARPAPDAAQEAPNQALFDQLVIRVANDLIDGFAARLKLRRGAPAAIHAALVGDGGELKEEAIRVAGQRKLRDEVPTLLTLLNHPDEPIRDAALGALIEMKERRAVPELTKTRSLRDRREMRKILDAIAILGGEEAVDYLSFVAQTHDDEEIRNLATAAKARLDRRNAPPDASRP